MPFFSGKTVFYIRRKERKGKQKKTEERGGFRARWGGPLGHLTWPLNPQKKQKQKQRQTKTRKQDKRKKEGKQAKPTNTKEWAIQLSSKFLFFGGGSKISLFLQLGQKSAHPKNTVKIGISAKQCFKTDLRHETAISWTKTTKTRNSKLSSFCFILLFQQQKTQQLSETPVL